MQHATMGDDRSKAEAAAVEEIASQLAEVARKNGLLVLAFLLDMAVAEAQDRHRSLCK